MKGAGDFRECTETPSSNDEIPHFLVAWYVPKTLKKNQKDRPSASIGGVSPTFNQETLGWSQQARSGNPRAQKSVTLASRLDRSKSGFRLWVRSTSASFRLT